MVKMPFLAFMFAFILSGLFAGEFTASVSSTQVYLSDGFTLNLTLKDISPKDTPDLSALKEHFVIRSQHKATNTSIINSRVSSSVTWKLFLVPKKEGLVEVPSITVDTSDGFLSTPPIFLTVVKGSNAQSSDESIGLNIITKVSNAAPYKNESFLYTAFLTSKAPLHNAQSEKIQMENAIVELVETPKLSEKVIDGVLQSVVELTYLITPLKSGPLTIPSIAIKGAVQEIKKRRPNSFFDDDDDDFNPFEMMHGFGRLKPFSLMTEEIQLNVQPAVAEVSPWLPARDLNLEEQWTNDQTLRVGEPFTRGFLINAEGVKGSQLPHLEDLQNLSGFKVYADKPQESETVTQGILKSIRKEQYTLIPQQAGTLVLPEISVNWWDTVKQEQKTSKIAARTVQILPAVEVSGADAVKESSEPAVLIAAKEDTPVPYLLYGIIGVLASCLVGAVFWALALKKRIAKLKQKPKDKREKLPDLNPT